MSRAPTARQHSNTENVRNSDRRFLLCAVSNKAGVTVELRVAPTGAAAAAARETIIGLPNLRACLQAVKRLLTRQSCSVTAPAATVRATIVAGRFHRQLAFDAHTVGEIIFHPVPHRPAFAVSPPSVGFR
jgi:hypothetical protein